MFTATGQEADANDLETGAANSQIAEIGGHVTCASVDAQFSLQQPRQGSAVVPLCFTSHFMPGTLALGVRKGTAVLVCRLQQCLRRGVCSDAGTSLLGGALATLGIAFGKSEVKITVLPNSTSQVVIELHVMRVNQWQDLGATASLQATTMLQAVVTPQRMQQFYMRMCSVACRAVLPAPLGANHDDGVVTVLACTSAGESEAAETGGAGVAGAGAAGVATTPAATATAAGTTATSATTAATAVYSYVAAADANPNASGGTAIAAEGGKSDELSQPSPGDSNETLTITLAPPS